MTEFEKNLTRRYGDINFESLSDFRAWSKGVVSIFILENLHTLRSKCEKEVCKVSETSYG